MTNKPMPEDPTEEILVAIQRIIDLPYNPANKAQMYQARHVYKAMWQAAPSPEPASGELERLAQRALLHLNKWLDADECDCEMFHVCGRPDIERTVYELSEALGVKQEKDDAPR